MPRQLNIESRAFVFPQALIPSKIAPLKSSRGPVKFHNGVWTLVELRVDFFAAGPRGNNKCSNYTRLSELTTHGMHSCNLMKGEITKTRGAKSCSSLARLVGTVTDSGRCSEVPGPGNGQRHGAAFLVGQCPTKKGRYSATMGFLFQAVLP